MGRGRLSREKKSFFYSQSFVVEDHFRKDDVLGWGKDFSMSYLVEVHADTLLPILAEVYEHSLAANFFQFASTMAKRVLN